MIKKIIFSLLFSLLLVTNGNAQTSSFWKNAVQGVASYTTTGVETSITAGKCLAPVMHFSNFFPPSGGKITRYFMYYGPAAIAQAASSVIIWDRQPSTTVINSCTENNLIAFTLPDIMNTVFSGNITNCPITPSVTTWGCGTIPLDTSGVETKSSDIWIALISVNSFVLPAVPGTIFGVRLDGRF